MPATGLRTGRSRSQTTFFNDNACTNARVDRVSGCAPLQKQSNRSGVVGLYCSHKGRPAIAAKQNYALEEKCGNVDENERDSQTDKAAISTAANQQL
jgi:hypothetical protein